MRTGVCLCARESVCVRASGIPVHFSMLSQLPRDSNSNYSKCREVGGAFTFQQDPADAVEGEEHVLLAEHDDVRAPNRRALVPSLLSPRLSRCASQSIPGSLQQLRSPTTFVVC